MSGFCRRQPLRSHAPKSADVWTALTGFRLNADRDRRVGVVVANKPFQVMVQDAAPRARSKGRRAVPRWRSL